MADPEQARFETLLKELVASMPDDESREQLERGFRKTWDAPPLEQLAMVTQRMYNLSQARQLMFFPEPVDMVQYVVLLMPAPKGAPKEHPQNKVRRHFLAVMYMRHVQSWPLMREFVREGGLATLAEGFVDENAYMRAQVVDTFLQLTSCELHDWFHEPILEPRVHRCFLDLSAPDLNFVAKIGENLGPDCAFPGGSYYCLQILAFWLSLVRYFYCESRVLRLSSSLMDLLKKWADTGGLPEEETTLAKQLRDDFGRFPTVDSMQGQLIGAAGIGSEPHTAEGLPQPDDLRRMAAAAKAAAKARCVRCNATFAVYVGSITAGVAEFACPACKHYPCSRLTEDELKQEAEAESVGGEEEEDGEPRITEIGGDGGDGSSGFEGQERIEAKPLRQSSAALPPKVRVEMVEVASKPASEVAVEMKPPTKEPSKSGGGGGGGGGSGSGGSSPDGSAASGGEPWTMVDRDAALLLTPQEEEAQRQAAKAAAEKAASWSALKQQGNTAFSKGEHLEAIRLYGLAIEAAPAAEAHLLLGNRCAAHLKCANASSDAEAKLAAAAAAEADSREAVKRRPDYLKGYYRLGSALLLKGEPSEAVSVLEDGLGRSPHNDELRSALREARAAQEAARREALKAAKSGGVKVGEVGESLPAATSSAAPAAGAKKPKAAVAVDYEAAAAAAARAAELAQQRRAAAASQAAANAAAASATGAVAADTVQKSAVAIDVSDTALPTTSQQFEREWKALKSAGASVDEQAAWLRRLPVASYAGLFKESLTEGMMVSLVDCAREYAQGAEAGSDAGTLAAALATDVLSGLASTRRFEMLTMFLDGKQQAAVQAAFKELKRLGSPAPPALAKAWGAK